jgi:hypothetical protein
MQLPNTENAFVSEEKLTQYLLNLAHDEGGSKARFFLRFGFSIAEWKVLAEALKQHALKYDIIKTEITLFGTRYVIEGKLQTPINRELFIRVVWFVRTHEEIPRFVTAYPVEEDSDDS